jgi:hypothetical protein
LSLTVFHHHYIEHEVGTGAGELVEHLGVPVLAWLRQAVTPRDTRTGLTIGLQTGK